MGKDKVSEEIKAIDLILYKSYESDIGVGKEYYNYIMKFINNQQKEIEKYERYFKLAISDLQSEGYMQMPYENVEKYYSKRGDIV